MAELLERRWSARFEGMSRQDRRGCTYHAYMPDPLEGWDLNLPADLAADIADAETAVRRLSETGTAHVSLEGLARFLLRAESVASSWIEGLRVGPRRLIEAELALTENVDMRDRTAVEILGNITAMETAIELAVGRHRITTGDILTIHERLMRSSPHPEFGGRMREVQNWIGGSSYNPCSAAFVPPPSEQVSDLIEDLTAYVNRDDHSPLVQAALAHAQFETIHPFADGNGRTGRALIHIILQRRGLAPRFVPPVSLVLATWATDYISGLTAFRHLGPADSPERSVAAHAWLRTFAVATARSCADAEAYASRIDVQTDRWRSSIGQVRAGSALDQLLAVLPGVPLVTVESAALLIDRSKVAAAGAINRLQEAGVLRQRNLGRKRYRVYEAPDVLESFTGLERALASPAGDTAIALPNRTVPARR